MDLDFFLNHPSDVIRVSQENWPRSLINGKIEHRWNDLEESQNVWNKPLQL
jgi:hypothetical protein